MPRTTITKLDDVIELNGQGNIRKALAFYVLAFEQLRQEAFKNGVHTTQVEIGGFCEKYDIVFYGKDCPFCTHEQ